jgi:hypothetical protein
MTTAATIQAIINAIAAFDGAYWTHEYKINGVVQKDDDGEPLYCEGGTSDCSTCSSATSVAASCEMHGCNAISAIEAGDVSQALTLVNRAATEERQFGDCPGWGPAVEAVEAWGKDLAAIRELARQDVSGETDDSYARTGDATDAINRWCASAATAGDSDLTELVERLGVEEAAKMYEAARS